MGRRSRPKRKPKPVALYIVEGSTEKNYIKCLKSPEMFREGHKVRSCDGGGAKNVLNVAEDLIEKYGGMYSGYVIWFDKDTYTAQEKNLKEKLSRRKKVTVVMSDPCVENWLLAHFQNPIRSRSTRCRDCESALCGYIPNYSKSNYLQLQQNITRDQVLTAVDRLPKVGKAFKGYFC